MPNTDKQTRDNLSRFHQPVTMPGGYSFNHIQTLKRVDLYYNSQFESGNTDSSGFHKYFYNVVKPSCDVATKFIDIDTKDVILRSERENDEYRIWMMKKDLQLWLKKEKIGVLFNEIGFDFPKYGTVVVKKGNDNKWRKVNIQNLRMEPGAPSLESSSFVYEVIEMTKREVREMGWDTEECKAFLENYEEARCIVYACYDFNPDEGKKWVLSYKTDFLKAQHGQGTIETAESQINNQSTYKPGWTLYEEEVDELPYRELHWEKVPGRWLGFGYVEYLFDDQMRQNELVNIKAKGLYFTSLHLYQTRDQIPQRNVSTDLQNGDILPVVSEITPIANEERNLAHFQQEEQRWDHSIDRKTFAFDVARGGDLPSQTPLGVAQMQAGQILGYFELKRENLGMFIKNIILADVIPQFKKQTRKEHAIKFLGSESESEKLLAAFTEAETRKKVFDYALKNGVIPTPENIAQFRMDTSDARRKVREFYVTIPEGFYDDVQETVDVLITNESLDVSSRLQTLQIAMQMISGNPAIIQDTKLRTVFFKMLELAGVNPVELNMIDSKMEMMPPSAQEMMGQMPQAAPQASPRQVGGMQSAMMQNV